MAKLSTIPTKLSPVLIEELDTLVKAGFYPSRSEAIREAVRRLITEEAKRLEPSSLYLKLLEREILGKIKEKSVEEIVKEAKKIRKELWEKRR